MRLIALTLPLMMLVACDALDPYGDLPTEGAEYESARERVTIDCNIWLDALEEFRAEFERYPRGREGLRHLVFVPPDHVEYPIWNGPYGIADETFLMDPWKRPYHYESTAEHIAIISEGRDRQFRTADDIRVEREVTYH